ncbi:hypothetical protein IAQ61_003663 [Plenodomus lingam]|uniref:Oxysterol-binding protein n=1 Tax=Leptosphaeria maculans (strain JN3 / isolate v23.1.3 / race Av1-4-5-6-7-8) TaxID=985895 RepID=E4ZRB2_LEPMJ|nr:hypothetical protein LEMA_P034510.1 [Plenodomus lingam JN3]KAH9874474.1 hypothetical protein IAQ61_003663 [Plenodomus lingam]CBX93777.1 hypothetical protein LEMA_P034510.1 [Plenodomus lingam JN3]
MSNDIVSNRSTLKEFLASIATISGDLSNITAPPFVLAENSTVEIPQYWADHPDLFVAPAAEPDPEKRALLVLKWFLGSLRNQQYAGRREDEGVKKPLNAFLGELFLGSWQDAELGETRLVSEQVSHHPPITACYLWNEKHGVRAEGFTQQEITFNGSVHIKQKGYAVLHIDKYDEDYLIPVPNVKVKGILSGMPYPELQGSYSLISSSGYVSHIKFEGKGFFGTGTKNGFQARLYHLEQPKHDLYTVKGAWNGVFSIADAHGAELETFDVDKLPSVKLDVPDPAEQDPWESRRAWGEVIAALRRGDMRGTTDAKSRVEQGQREMRKQEEAQGKLWTQLFFHTVQQDAVFERLSVHDRGSYTVDGKGGGWKVETEAVRTAKKPFHADLVPTNQRINGRDLRQEQEQPQAQAQKQDINRGDKVQNQPRPQTPPTATATPPTHTSSDDNGATNSHPPSQQHVPDDLDAQMDTLDLQDRHTMGAAVTGASSANTPPLNNAVREPSVAQVEDFLRARYSNLH